jgi:hypothetical protein
MAAQQLASTRGESALPPGIVLGAVGLAAASAVELLILRTFTRTAIHIPGITALREPYEALSFGGRYAYFVAVALLVFALPASAVALWRCGPVQRGMAAAIGTFALMSGLAAAAASGRLALDAATAGAVAVVAVGLAAVSRRWETAIPVGLFAAAFILSSAHTLGQSAAQEGVLTLRTDGALTAAEVVGVAFALCTPLLARGLLDRAALVAGAGTGLVVFAAFLGNGGATARFLLLWNEGLSGALPSIAYAAAAGCLAATLVAFIRARDGLAAAGVALLVTGGIGLHSTYQSGLVITGMALLALALPAAARGRSTAGEAKPRGLVPAPADV